VFKTDRLAIRRARTDEADIELVYRLWTDPKVMTPVGFPHGLRITRQEIAEIVTRRDSSVLSAILIAEKLDGDAIGHCKLGVPDDEGIAETDIKMLPSHWGQGYGTEIKQGLVDYLFTHTGCKAVKATPNRNNIASQKMQEAVGGRRVGEGVFTFPEEMRDHTVDVPHFIYMVCREEWEKRRQ